VEFGLIVIFIYKINKIVRSIIVDRNKILSTYHFAEVSVIGETSRNGIEQLREDDAEEKQQQ
jgi:hypothetical protein